MTLVIADTGPIHYLTLIDAVLITRILAQHVDQQRSPKKRDESEP